MNFLPLIGLLIGMLHGGYAARKHMPFGLFIRYNLAIGIIISSLVWLK